YKEGQRKPDPKVENQLLWLRQMYDWLKDAHAPEDLLDSVRRNFQAGEVYVFTPKGELKELPKGATPLDFAYMVHTTIGHTCIGARANGRIVPLRYNLQTGDVIEILTSKNQTPHRDWIDIVVTGKARMRIRQKLRELGEMEVAAAKEKGKQPQEPKASQPSVRQVDDATRKKLVRIEGMREMAVQFAKCCNPMPGHPILAYARKSPGVTVHRVDCRSFANTQRDPARILRASWEGDEQFETSMRVTLGPRPNVLADVTNAMRPMNVNITEAEYRAGKNGKSFFDFTFETSAPSHAEHVARILRTVSGVTEVHFVSPKKVKR
ncbi:MAG TPA: bifunctional (p)ppGpp synthetase/guanosine-3',5'-bis(diphosphate) 3'-pyrophosphohydrolase, partial [Candidatus Hydrogenedentes bacterium]|nr:bifunctional (p)ppGpp synthetase/guanosine-3',5'-bis(diphosphate) 3'-pyrophosphohydrolase [Candidatus Hydrogenedentota bacterium]